MSRSLVVIREVWLLSSARLAGRGRRSVAGVAAVVIVGAALTGCTGSGGSTSASPSLDLTLRAIATCPATVTIPPDVSTVVPAATNPPTSVLRRGDALAFTAPRGSKIGAVGSSDRSQKSVICQSSRGTGSQRRAIILGRSPGFIQVALMLPGRTAVQRTLVTVTG